MAVSPPAEIVERRLCIHALSADFGWRLAIQGAVNAMLVIIGTNLRELFLQVDGVPEEDVVEVFPADRAN